MTNFSVTIDAGLLHRFLEAAIAAIPHATRALVGEGRLRMALDEHLRVGVARTADLEFAAAREKWCPVDGAATAEYLYGIDAVGAEVALTSIRFRSRDRERAFVQLEASTTNRLSEGLRSAIRERYERFAPKALRWFESTPGAPLEATVIPDLRLVAGAIEAVVAHRPASADRLRLVQSTGLDWYDRYVAGYEEYFREYPELVGELNYETRETLQTILDQGKLFEAWVDGRWAGVAGTWREREYFIDGEVIVERMLVPELRGQGLGPALVWHLAAALPVPPSTLLFGMIAPKNVRSLRSAASAGRIDVGGYVFGAL